MPSRPCRVPGTGDSAPPLNPVSACPDFGLLTELIRLLEPVYDNGVAETAVPPREFRTCPAAVHDVHANLSIANVDFEEFAEEASTDTDGVLRPF